MAYNFVVIIMPNQNLGCGFPLSFVVSFHFASVSFPFQVLLPTSGCSTCGFVSRSQVLIGDGHRQRQRKLFGIGRAAPAPGTYF